jgi:hypothetical protein
MVVNAPHSRTHFDGLITPQIDMAQACAFFEHGGDRIGSSRPNGVPCEKQRLQALLLHRSGHKRDGAAVGHVVPAHVQVEKHFVGGERASQIGNPARTDLGLRNVERGERAAPCRRYNKGGSASVAKARRLEHHLPEIARLAHQPACIQARLAVAMVVQATMAIQIGCQATMAIPIGH